MRGRAKIEALQMGTQNKGYLRNDPFGNPLGLWLLFEKEKRSGFKLVVEFKLGTLSAERESEGERGRERDRERGRERVLPSGLEKWKEGLTRTPARTHGRVRSPR